jgi:hypothetical protein
MLPFAALALLAWLPAVPLDAVSRLFLIYALAITAFLSGTLWGRASGTSGADKTVRLCASNGFVLVGAFALAFAHARVAAVVFLLLFWAILLFEWKVAGQRGWYLRYRLQLTLAVSLFHALFIAALR